MAGRNEAIDAVMQAAWDALAGAEDAVQLTLRSLKARAGENGKLNDAKLDEYQLVCYDTALNAAEVHAAKFMIDYARAVRDQLGDAARPETLEERMALAFTAEAIRNIARRAGDRREDFGLSEEEYEGRLGCPVTGKFCDEQLTTARLAELGELIAANEGRAGAYLLDEQHEMFRETFRKFAADVVAPRAEHVHRDDALIPDEILNSLRELGCFGLSIPEKYGGLQPDDREDNMGMIVVTEELSRGSLGAAGSLITRPEILAKALLKGGTEAQKQKWLPKLAAGEPLNAIAVTEPDYGSDVAAMKFKATRVEGGWKLEGAKTWCTFAGKAGVLLVLARTNPDPKAGHKGLSLFLAEKPSHDGHDFEYTQPEGGKMSGRAIATIGYRGMHSYEMFFENFFVPDENLIGGAAGEGKGFYFTMAGFTGGRIQTAARAVGVMQAAFEHAVRYAGERKVFGQPIANYQLSRVKLARMAMLLCACRQYTYAVGRLLDHGKGQMDASMVKLFASRSAEWLTREAMQLHGGMGYAEETAVSRFFVDARVLSIFEGAEETLALKVIARALVDQAGSGAAD